MKKLLLINTKYKISGGEDANIIDEFQFLQKHYEVKFIEFDNSKNLTILDFVAFFTNNNFKSNNEVLKIIKTFKPEIIYVHNTWFRLNLGIFKILKNYKNIKVIVKIHNLRYDCSRHFTKKGHLNGQPFCKACSFKNSSSLFFNKYYKESWIKSLLLWRHSNRYIKILRNFPLQILVLNSFHKKYLLKLGIESSKILNYYNPIDYEKNTYNPNSNYVVYAGRLNHEKGLLELLKAWKSSRVHEINLKIVGTGELFETLKSDYESDDINFLGELDNDVTKQLIKNARAVITATKMYEGQPRLLCEASSFGVPSIYPSFGGMDEYFPNKYTFKFNQFDYEDLIKKIKQLRNKKQLINESNRIFEHVENIFSYENSSKVFNNITQTP